MNSLKEKFILMPFECYQTDKSFQPEISVKTLNKGSRSIEIRTSASTGLIIELQSPLNFNTKREKRVEVRIRLK